MNDMLLRTIELFGPPLLYLAVAASLLAAARRFVVPISRPALLALVFLPLFFTGRALLTGRVYAPIDLPFQAWPMKGMTDEYGVHLHNAELSDIYCLNIPWKKAVRVAYQNGEPALWNPFAFAGDILGAAAQGTQFEPVFLLSLLLPMAVSLTFLATVTFFLAGLAMFLYLRDVGCREPSALMGAVGWMFGGFIAFWLEWVIASTALWFPLVLLGVRRIVRQRSISAPALLLFAFVMAILNGHPESLLHIVAVGLVYAGFELAAARPDRRAFGRIAASGISAGILALLVCAVYLMPILEALPHSYEHFYREAVYTKLPRSLPLEDSIEVLKTNALPFLYGSNASEPREPPPPLSSHASAYAGSVVFPFALYGLWRSRWRGRWLMLGFLLFGYLAGANAPPLADWLAKLPLFDIALNNRLTFVALFALSVLAALGAEAVASAERPSSAIALLAVVAAALLGAAVLLEWRTMVEHGLSPAYLQVETLKLLLPLLLAAAALLGIRSPAVVVTTVVLILAGQRAAEISGFYPTNSARIFYPPIPGLDQLPKGGQPYRVVGLGYTFIPNTGTMYGLEDARGYQAMTFRRHAELFDLWSVPQPVWFNRVDDLTRPFLSFLNVRYAIADPRVTSPPPGWKVAARAPALMLFENERVLPRAFVPSRVRINYPDDETIAQMRGAGDFSWLAWIEHPSGGAPAGEIPNGPGRASLRATAMNRRSIEVRMDAPGWLVVSEANWPGWRAYRDGQRIPIRFANHAYIGLYLPAGRQHVDLVYFPSSFRVGAAVSIATILGMVIASMILLRRRSAA